MTKQLVTVEEDGDEVFTKLPKGCILWGCDNAPIRQKGRFMCCVKCGASYGKARGKKK